MPDEPLRDDLAELLRRRALTQDAARPDAVARRHDGGARRPGAHLGPMGLEGAVRLGLRKELEAIADDDEREQAVRAATAAAERNARALNSASMFELDDVIDPSETRTLIAATLAAAAQHPRPAATRRFVDTW